MTQFQDKLRLIKISHDRCNEYTATTYVLAPLEWSANEINTKLLNAKKTYLEAVELAKKDIPKPAYFSDYQMYDKYPDKTVAEVKELIAQKRAELKEYDEEQRKTKKKFESFLKEEGFQTLWETDDIPQFEVSWGHRHGTAIDYSETDTDTLPVPIKVVDPEFEEDDF